MSVNIENIIKNELRKQRISYAKIAGTGSKKIGVSESAVKYKFSSKGNLSLDDIIFFCDLFNWKLQIIDHKDQLLYNFNKTANDHLNHDLAASKKEEELFQIPENSLFSMMSQSRQMHFKIKSAESLIHTESRFFGTIEIAGKNTQLVFNEWMNYRNNNNPTEIKEIIQLSLLEDDYAVICKMDDASLKLWLADPLNREKLCKGYTLFRPDSELLVKRHLYDELMLVMKKCGCRNTAGILTK